jgi:hypothetical protein
MVSNWPYFAQFTYFLVGNDDGAVFLSIGHQNGQQGPSIKKKNAKGDITLKSLREDFSKNLSGRTFSKKRGETRPPFLLFLSFNVLDRIRPYMVHYVSLLHFIFMGMATGALLGKALQSPNRQITEF